MLKVSVLMSVYNSATYLHEAIDSILEQSFTNFEFIIIDDGSTDETPSILKQYSQKDARIILLKNPQNIGLTRSLNRGLETAQGEFIARMDADDIAVPTTRLEDQIALMENHPEIGFLSGDMISINQKGHFFNDKKPVYGKNASHHYLTWLLLWQCPISHITVMMRRSILDKYHLTYRPEYNLAEDFELWTTLTRHTIAWRTTHVWAYRRIVSTSVSRRNLEKQLALIYQIMKREICLLLGNNTSEDGLQTLFDMIHLDKNQHTAFKEATDIIVMIYQHYLQKPLTPEEKKQIQGDSVSYLLRLSKRARPFSKKQALYPLWQLRHISTKEFLSRNTLKYIIALQR